MLWLTIGCSVLGFLGTLIATMNAYRAGYLRGSLDKGDRMHAYYQQSLSELGLAIRDIELRREFAFRASTIKREIPKA